MKKRLLKKRFLIPLIVVAMLAIGAVAAYAAFSTTASTPAYASSTGDAHISLGLVGSQWDLSNLVPASGPTSPAARSETISVTNDGKTNLEINLTASFNNVQAGDGSYWGDVLDIQVAGPYGTWNGTLDQLNALNGGLGADLGAWGQGAANVTLTVWLNSGAGNAWQNWSGTPITFNFNGTQNVQ